MRKAKPTWSNKNIKVKQYDLGNGDKGFLCSCNGQEKQCIRECYNILNKYADMMFKETVSEENSHSSQAADQTSDPTNATDLDEEFKEEIECLKKAGEMPKRFQVVTSGAKNLLFIRTTVEDPVALASAIIKEVQETKELQTRYLIRLVPIETTCKAYIDNIKRACIPLLDRHFNDNPRSFSIVYNHRNNKNLSKDEVIKTIADLIGDYKKGHTVNLNHADVSIIVEVIKGNVLLAVIPQYIQYKKFNLHSLCDQSNSKVDKSVDNEPIKSCSVPEEIKN